MSTVINKPGVRIDPNEILNAEATATFPESAGRIGNSTPTRPGISVSELGSRKLTAVADAIELTVTLKDPKAALLKVWGSKGGQETPFVIRGGTRVEVYALPATQKDDLEHFCHFFTLLEGDPPCEEVKKCPSCASCDTVSATPAASPSGHQADSLRAGAISVSRARQLLLGTAMALLVEACGDPATSTRMTGRLRVCRQAGHKNSRTSLSSLWRRW